MQKRALANIRIHDMNPDNIKLWKRGRQEGSARLVDYPESVDGQCNGL
jgi:hypothetical protein